MKINVSDEQLACLAQMGDKRASEILLNKYKHRVKNICLKYYIVGNTNDDIIQEGMIGLYRAIMNYSKEKNDSFSAFASMCIKRRVLSVMNSANRKKNIPLNTSVSLNKPVNEEGKTLGEIIEDSTNDPEKIYISSEKIKSDSQNIIDALSKMEKSILVEYLQERSYDEIAQKLGISRKSVDNAMQRIRLKISKLKIK